MANQVSSGGNGGRLSLPFSPRLTACRDETQSPTISRHFTSVNNISVT